MIKNTCQLIIASYLIYPCIAFAQSKLILYDFGQKLPQTNMLNPGIIPNHKIIIGLPVISGIHAGASNSGIAYRDIFSYDDDGILRLDTARVIDKFKNQHRIRANAELQLLYFGLRVKKHYFSLGLHTIAEARISFPSTLISWIYRGPLHPKVQNSNLDLNDLKIKGLAYHQLSLGYAYQLSKKLNTGIRIKYLMGIAGIESRPANGNIYLGLDSLHLDAKRMTVYTAGLDGLTLNDLLGIKNYGLALDMGATYQFNYRLSMSASITDLGFMVWKNNTRTYQTLPGKYTFSGIGLLQALRGSLVDGKALKDEVKKLGNELNFTEGTAKIITTSLIGRAYLGANYKIYKDHKISTSLYLDFFQGDVNPAFGVAYNVPFAKVFNGVAGLSYRNGQINNIGLGLSIKLGNAQLYMASDRVNSMYYPARLPQANLQVGINLLFDRPKIDETPIIKDSTAAEPPKVEIPPVAVPPQPRVAPKPLIIKPRKRPGKKIIINYYIIVGSFQLRENAHRYSKKLKRAGYENHIGFLTDKYLYYIYTDLFKNDLEAAQKKTFKLQNMDKFLFSKSWILAIPEIKSSNIDKFNE